VKKYPEYKNLNLQEFAAEVQNFWDDKGIFDKSLDRKDAPNYTFYEGPPSANGMPGIHHVLARTIKDVFCRYKTLKGFKVDRKGGWDTHGLPIELSVEKTLGITKVDIGTKITVEEYNAACRKEVMKYKEKWDELTTKMGYWLDLENPYVTFENEYIESLWSILKKLYDKDFLYKGYTIQPYSPAAGTGLSSHELNQPGCYKNVRDTSATAQFKAIYNDNSKWLFDRESDPVHFIAWTTTPWTLPANCALAIGKKIDYVLVSTFNQYTFEPVKVILAKDLVGKYFSEKAKQLELSAYKAGDKLIPFKVEKEFKGQELVGIEYEQLLPYVQPKTPAFRVIPADFVTTEDGTGIVHTASVFGADDFRVCKENNIPSIMVEDENGNEVPLVDKEGKFVKEVTDFAGLYVREEYYAKEITEAKDFKSTDVLISIKLKEDNKAFKIEKYEHSYPHCWRTDKPILYYPLDSWFIKTTAVKERMVALNKEINWKPESTGTGRFGNWLENLVDWNLSRSRFWGTPLPIWRTEDGTEQKCIGSIAELEAEIKKAQAAGIKTSAKVIDLHRPYVDDIFLVSDSGKKMSREADLIDVWFDSGAMPYAQWHYPFENEDKFKESFPADFIAEGVDQTRGWFFTLHAISVMLFDQIAYKNVVSNGLVLDKDGNKMSKRLGNAADPFKTIDDHSADATRWYLISNASPWDNLRFNEEGIQEVKRKFFGTLYNTYAFFTLYANIDGFNFSETRIPVEERPELDRWIISKLNSVIKEVEEQFDDYNPTKASRIIQSFVGEQLSNWYVRLSRRRFWKGEYSPDKIAAYQTLYECLTAVSKLMAPIAPFYAEKLFKDLNKVTNLESSESVHLSTFPLVEKKLIDKDLEERMAVAQDITSLVLGLRKDQQIKVRQPLNKILIPVTSKQFEKNVKAVEELILSEVNVKSIEYVTDTSGILIKKMKPDFKKLGPRFGKNMKDIGIGFKSLGQEHIQQIEKEGFIELAVGGTLEKIMFEEVEISSEDIPGWLVANNGNLTVALDVKIDEKLKNEGLARELVNRIQNLRKDKGFEVTDTINVKVQRHSLINSALEQNKRYICEEVLATDLFEEDENQPQEDTLEIEGEQIFVTITR
jgi:isoleucyl-tRNA synthetase